MSKIAPETLIMIALIMLLFWMAGMLILPEVIHDLAREVSR